MKYQIKNKEAGERLDKFATEKLPDFSRSYVQKMIKNGLITVNGKKITPHHFLKTDDIVVIKSLEIAKTEKTASTKKSGFKLEIVAETEQYLVVNKPTGIAMHGAEHMKEISLADLIIAKYPAIKKIGEDPSRPGIVHRIDKEVSGLVVVPKTQEAFDDLKKQFKERTIKKQYTALVYGKVEKESGEINFPIKRSEKGHKMAAMPLSVRGEKNITGRRAITSFRVEEKFINYTLLRVNIKTGRTHQIRVHMLAFGHPIVGDNLYSTSKTRMLNKKMDLGRVFLFADKLSFVNLEGETKTYEIEMPSELKKFMKKVK